MPCPPSMVSSSATRLSRLLMYWFLPNGIAFCGMTYSQGTSREWHFEHGLTPLHCTWYVSCLQQRGELPRLGRPRSLTFCFLVLQRLQAKATLLRFPGRTSSSCGRAVAHSGILASDG